MGMGLDGHGFNGRKTGLEWLNWVEIAIGAHTTHHKALVSVMDSTRKSRLERRPWARLATDRPSLLGIGAKPRMVKWAWHGIIKRLTAGKFD